MNPSSRGRKKKSKPLQTDYVNDQRKTPSAAAAAHQQHVSTVFFSSTSQNDLNQPWFHKKTSRDEAIGQLETAEKGSFVVRPSSQRSCYALSWLDDNNSVRFV